MKQKIYAPLSALNAYDYCPHRVYLEFVCGQWEDNTHTIKGILNHERTHSGEKRYDGNRIQTTQVYIKSDEYNLVGKVDIVEEKNDEIYPVEYKQGQAGQWTNDHLQLCAEAICLEEQLGIEIKKGYLWYFGSRSREEVYFESELREKTIWVAQEVLKIMKHNIAPEKEYTSRCKGCSLQNICLPQEITQLKRKEQK